MSNNLGGTQSLAAAPPPAKLGWRGKRGQILNRIRFRWQRDWTAASTQRLRAADRRRRIRVAVLIGLLVSLVGLLVYAILFAPVQTPLVTIAATKYSWPFVPNAWAHEDLAALSALNGETVTLTDLTSDWMSREQSLASFDEKIRDLAASATRCGSLVIYVSMHGLVDATGAPCLAPPNSAPQKSETWLPLSEVLAQIRALDLPDECHKLLVLDCNRQLTNGNLGLLYNGFAEALPRVVADAEIPNLAVLNSTSAGEIGWSSPELRASVFGHYLQRGLAGHADQTDAGGNGDRRVSLHELHAYLEHEVNRWARTNRAASQRPMLVPADAADVDVLFALDRRSQRRLDDDVEKEPASSVSANQIAQLWRLHDRLIDSHPQRFAPWTWCNVEHQLLWLEQLASAGAAYTTPASNAQAELQRKLNGIVARAEQAKTHPDLFHQWNVFAEPSVAAPDSLVAHETAAARFLGQLSPEQAATLDSELAHLKETATAKDLADLLTRWPVQSGKAPLADVQFLRIWDRNLPKPVWQQPELVRRVLELRTLAGEACVPPDERSVTTTATALDCARGDGPRRSAEDLLLIGDSGALAQVPQLCDQASQAYNQAKSAGALMAEAWQRCDRVQVELPYLADWIARPLLNGGAVEAAGADEIVVKQLLPLIDETHLLTHRLASGEQISGQPSWLDLYERVVRRHDELRKLYSDDCARLAQTRKTDGRVVREIESLLAAPLATVAERESLTRLAAQLRVRLHEEHAATAGEPIEAGQKPFIASASEHAARIVARWPQHPTEAILLATDDEDTNPLPIDRAGSRRLLSASSALRDVAERSEVVRSSLANMPARLRQLLDSTGAGAEVMPTTPAEREPRAMAEHLARFAGSFWFPPTDVDPVRQLRLFDLQQLLVARAECALDDFLGPAGSSETAPYDLAAADYLRAARDLTDIGSAVQRQLDSLAERLSQRRSAAQTGLVTSAADVLLVGEADQARLDLKVRPGPVAAWRGLPVGTATITVRDTQGVLAGTERPLGLVTDDKFPAEAVQVHYDLPNGEVADRGPILQATAAYRGHEFASSFLLRASGGTTIDFRPHRYGPAQVTLSGRNRRRSSIVFILDCSHSMTEPTAVESPQDEQVPRLDVARNALASMLTQLAEAGDTRVGVRFYGHRVGWNTSKPDQLLHQTDYGRQIPDSLRPSDDVELVLPLGRFDTVIAGGVLQLLPTLKPWGETPLYLSLVQAQSDFAKDDPDTDKRIIVITDGINYQFNARRPQTMNDVLAAGADRRVPIFIVGFGIAAQDAEKARTEFTTLAERTGGSYVPVNSATSLIRSLEAALGPSLYSVSDASGREMGQAAIGSPITVRATAQGLRPYTVGIDTIAAEVELAGGEAAELVVSNREIFSVRYERNDPVFAELMSEGAPTGILVGVHRPVWFDRGVRFPFSFQRADSRFMPRPAESWIEVSPPKTSPHAAESRYIFYDVNYEPQLPVPVLDWTATGWPAEVQKAEVRVWCKPQRTPPTSIVPVADALRLEEGTAVEGVRGVSWQVRGHRPERSGEPWRVAVVERHSGDSAGLGSLKLDIDPPPQRIVRRFDAKHRLVTHTFYIDATDDAELAGYELRFTPRDAIQRGAWQLDEPLVVPIAAQADVIKLAP